MRTFRQAIEHRRSYYSINDISPVSNNEIIDIINHAVKNVPSAFNSQSTRIVLLLGDHHHRLWNIVKNTLKEMNSPESYEKTEMKINSCFACGYGTILFFEDQHIINGLQQSFSTYKDKFPEWSVQTCGMHQFAIWTMLEDAGFGASLQHYNPLIDEAVRKEWDLPVNWKLDAQMPFGVPTEEPGNKEFDDLSQRIKIYK